MKAIFNADDFGYSKGVNLGIIETYQCGPVRSATIMAGMPGFDHAVTLAKANPGLNLGVHLTLSTGSSVGGVYKTLTDGDGRFLRLDEVERKARAGETDLDEVEAEYEAQIQKVLAAGVKPDHLDSHHHTHNLPGIVTVFLKMAKKYGVKVRAVDKSLLTGEYAGIRTTDSFSIDFYGETATMADLQRILAGAGGESIEIMCHPAFIDYNLHTSSSYNIKRAYELNILTNPEIMNFMAQCGIELCSFREL